MGMQYLYAYRARIHYDLKQYHEAIDDYTHAIQLDSRYVEAYNNRGAVYHSLGQYHDAIADFTDAIRLDPQYTLAYNYRGSVYEILSIRPIR